MEQDHVRLRREDLACLLVEARGYEDLREDLGDLTGQLPVDGLTQSHDAAEGRGWVGGESLPVRPGEILRNRRPAWIGVLDNDRRRLARFGEVRQQGARGVHVVE